jgi:hypothetical protein
MSPERRTVYETPLLADLPADVRKRFGVYRSGMNDTGRFPGGGFGRGVFGSVAGDTPVFLEVVECVGDLREGWTGWSGIALGSGMIREILHNVAAPDAIPDARSASPATRNPRAMEDDLWNDDHVRRYAAQWMNVSALPGWGEPMPDGEARSPLAAWENADRTVAADAARSGNLPGTPMEFDPTREQLPVDWFGGSIHAFGLPRAIELSGAPGPLPGRMVAMGSEGRPFEPECGLCPPIRKTADALADRLKTELQTGSKLEPEGGKDGARGVGGCYSERST